MQGKKSFTAYCDWLNTFEELTDEEAGKLVKHLFRYVNDQQPEAPDRITELLFTPIKTTLKRDLEKWLKRCEANRGNGSKGGRPKNPTEPKKPNGLNGNPTKPKKADSDSDSDSEKEVNISFDEFWDLYDHKKGSKVKCEKKWRSLKDSERVSIINTLPSFINSISEKKYQPHPLTYLNNQRWEDEIEPTPQSQVADDLKPFLDIVNNDPKYKYKTDSQKVFEAGVLKALSQNS